MMIFRLLIVAVIVGIVLLVFTLLSSKQPRSRDDIPSINEPDVEVSSTREQELGMMKVESGIILASDPCYLDNWEEGAAKVADIPVGDFPVILTINNTNGDQRVFKAAIKFSAAEPTSKSLVGHVPVDSGSACFIDESTFKLYYKAIGPDRIGEFFGKNHEKTAQKVKKRFSLDYVVDSDFSSHITTPVTEEMEKEILSYLGKYDKYPAFSVKTNNTYDQIVSGMDKTYVHTYGTVNLIMDETSKANVVAFSSGYGDGDYNLYAYYADNQIVKLELDMGD